MFTALWFLMTGSVEAGDQHTLTWDLSIADQSVGRRSLTVKYAPSDHGVRRILETWTEVDGQVGSYRIRFRQRMTGHAEGREPAAFQSVVDENGSAREIQGRWTPSGWLVTNLSDGRARTVEMPLDRIDISTTDILDPGTAWSMSRFETLRILSAETGLVERGLVEPLGMSEIKIGGTPIQVMGFAWDGPQGRSLFYFGTDGYLVRSETPMFGVNVVAQLTRRPPGGPDDFAVPNSVPRIEHLPL